jgi:GT2 family glycosyltransferase
MKSVCVVVLNYRTWQDTVECLRSVLKDPYRPRQIVVVDNASRNESVQRIAGWAAAEGVSLEVRPAPAIPPGASSTAEGTRAEIILLESPRNGGYAAGNNVGIRYALLRHFDFILILNNDTLVGERFLEPLVRFMESHPECGAAGPLIVDEQGAVDRTCARRRPQLGDYFFRLGLLALVPGRNRWKRRHYYIDEYSFDVPHPVDVLSGACLLIRREALDRTGLLDERTFLYLEEFIFHERLRDTPFMSYIVPESRIVHKGGRSTRLQPNTLLHGAELDSVRFYLREYRHFSPLLVGLITANLRLARLAGHLAARGARR